MRLLTSALLFLVSALSFAQVPAPVAARHPVIDTYPDGLKVTDDYRWLEDGTSAETRRWTAAENAHTTAVLDALPLRDKVLAFLKQQSAESSTTYGRLEVRNGRLFALRRDPTDSARKLVTFASPQDKASEREILNLGKITPGTLYQADWYSVSPDGKLVGLALSTGGSEDASLHVFSTATGKPVGEILPHVQFATAGGSMAWKADSSGYFYTRYPRGTERPAEDANFYQQLFFHKLGTPTSGDTYILGRELPRIGEIWLTQSPDGSQILVHVENGDGGEYEFFVVDPDFSVHQVSTYADKIASAVFGTDNSLWLLSHRSSPHGEFLHLASASRPLAQAKVVIPASEVNFEPDATFEDLSRDYVSSDRLFATVINGGPEEIRVYSLEGTRLPDLSTPPIASIGGLVPAGRNTFLFSAVTNTSPSQWYRVTSTAQTQALPFRTESATSLSDIQVERVFATSKDGTKVPITLLYRKGLKRDSNAPTVLYGYGGYGISMTPHFYASNRLLFDAGGIYAVANIRGGAEYGDAWHTGGSLLHKQNVFDDFAASARFLIDQHYTSSAHLAAQGGSNGGLLMGAMITQHPELFKAVLSEVGIYDMLRVELDPNGAFNTSEFGSTKDPAQLKYLYAYSPYHHVIDKTRYPAILFVTGDNDHRVNPANSRKMIARLQAAAGSAAPILLLTNPNAGHGISTNVSEALLEAADSLAFIYSQIGVTP